MLQDSRSHLGSNRLLDLSEIAVLTGTTERMARRLLDQRKLPTVKVGRYVRVWSDDLAAYLDSATRPANPETRKR